MDELSFGSFCLIAVATFLFSLVLRQALGAKDTGGKPPPGPWNLPVIGSLHHFVGQLPHRALPRLSRRHGPLMLLRLGEVHTVIVSTPEAAMEVMKANDPVFASRPRGATLDIISCGGKGLVLAPYGGHWRQMRKVCVVELLSSRQVQRMESIRQDEVAHLVDSVVAASSSSASASPAAVVNLSQGLAALTNNIIARAVFGGKCRQQEEYLRELEVMSKLVGAFSLVDLFPSSRPVRPLSGAERHLRRSHARVQRILDDVIRERKEKDPSASAGASANKDDDEDDQVDVLLRLQKEGALSFPLTAEIIGAVVFDTFGATTDTTATTLECAMAELIRNPHATMARETLEVRQRLGQGRSTITSGDLGDLHYLRMAIKESLRLHPAAALILQASQEKRRVMGYEIPKDTPVTINAFVVAREPRHWGRMRRSSGRRGSRMAAAEWTTGQGRR